MVYQTGEEKKKINYGILFDLISITDIISKVWQTVRRVNIEIVRVKGLTTEFLPAAFDAL